MGQKACNILFSLADKEIKDMSKFIKTMGKIDRYVGNPLTKYAFNKLMKECGKVINLMIDNTNKKVDVSILLKGENTPIEVRIDGYEIIKNGSSASVLIKEASSDKEWVNAVLKNFVVGKSFDVPSDKIDLLNDFLG